MGTVRVGGDGEEQVLVVHLGWCMLQPSVYCRTDPQGTTDLQGTDAPPYPTPAVTFVHTSVTSS